MDRVGKRLHNLPQPLTSFVGREREIANARRLLGTCRLLTLTGTGGVGKTRLGQRIAASMVGPAHDSELGPRAAKQQAFPVGVRFVCLATLIDPKLVPQAVAAAVGVREEPERPLTATLADALRFEPLLLVLDNCEQLIAACAELVDTLLRACPDLRILATSRQPLGIAGETTLRVPSLALPIPPEESARLPIEDGAFRSGVGGGQPASDLNKSPVESEAVQLFVERARAAMPAFTLTDNNRAAVEQICRRLDGLPLAIELAAARVAVLSPEQIAARLGDRFRLLTGGSRTALPRYRTLRALIDWSHDLLVERERTLLRRLSVFKGSWTLEATEAVCACDGLDPDEIFDLLSGLVAKSLVQTDEHAGIVRYRFLESTREYAAEKLRDAGDETTLHERHRDWFLALAERAAPALHGPDCALWLDRLERDRESLRSALRWCIDRADAEPGLRMAGALSHFWLVRGPYREMRGVLAELLGSPAAQQRSRPIRAARANALLAAGWLATRQDDLAAADVQFREALAIGHELGSQRGLAIALFSIGYVARIRGEYPAARGHYAEAIQLFEGLGDDHWLARAHHDLGVAAYFDDDLAMARGQYEASLALFEGLGDQLGIGMALNDLGEVAFLRGELAEARALERACRVLARQIDDKERIGMALAALAGLDAAQGQPGRALLLAAAVTALNEATGQRNSPAWHALVERWLEPARRALSAEAVAEAQAAGRAMPLDEAIVLALNAHQPDVKPALAKPARGRSDSVELTRILSQRSRAITQLTRRELEVAALVARGLTNRQIAAELVIADGTATNHVKHILARLGLESRVQIAAWAIEHGLHRHLAS
jgi:predicted ATPase/DNA-binding CsgD family transcriptional regulator